jgi:ribosome-binding factor A
MTKEYNMPRKQLNSNRGDRIASKVQTLVAEILRDNYSDDALLSGVSLVGGVSHVGLQFVKLFYYSRSNDIVMVQKRLDEVTKTVRFELAARMNQKYVPEIKFEYDDTLDRAARIDELLNNLND